MARASPSVVQRVLERLGAQPSEDHAHKIVADCFQALDDIGFTIPANGCTYWNSGAMNPKDYLELDGPPAAVDSTNKTLAADAVHLARLLKEHRYPPSK